jgi:glycosyltransferase involved in cell wall biosynthesis
MSPLPRITLIVPAYNEVMALPRLLGSVDAARAAFVHGREAIEVVVADNASTDATAALARARGCTVAPVEKRCIAAARNGGARAATAPVLAFVDADSRLHPQTFNAIADTMRRPRTIGGATGLLPERWSAGIALTWAMLMPMIRMMGVDGGVVFCRRADWEQLGGYDESRYIAEDVDFLLRLKRLGRQRGERFHCLNRAKVVTSTRKFDRHGDWHYFTQMPWVAWQMLRSRGALSESARRYWYEDR